MFYSLLDSGEMSLERRDEFSVSEDAPLLSDLLRLQTDARVATLFSSRPERRKRNFSLGLAGLCCNQGCTKHDIGRLCWVRSHLNSLQLSLYLFQLFHLNTWINVNVLKHTNKRPGVLVPLSYVTDCFFTGEAVWCITMTLLSSVRKITVTIITYKVNKNDSPGITDERSEQRTESDPSFRRRTLEWDLSEKDH